MLFALRHPAALLGLVLGFTVGCYVRVVVGRLLVRSRGRLHAVGRAGALHGVSRPAAWLDPFGVVAAVLSGIGWAPRQEAGYGKTGRLWTLAVGAVVAHAAVAAAGFAVYHAMGGSLIQLKFASTVDLLHGSVFIGMPGREQAALAFAVENVGCGLLSIVPIPPLETGVAAWTQFPRSPGVRRAAYHALEEQWGVAALLVLLLLPLAGGQPILLAAVGAVGDHILAAL